MEKKLTAVEWLIESLPQIDWEHPHYGQLVEQAKEMENEELLDAFKSGWMRANAMNYQDSYFDYYINNK